MRQQKEPFTTTVVLADGGVYANLELETARKRYKTILVGAAGGQLAPEGNPRRNLVGHTLRVKKKRLTNASITLMTVKVFSICLSLDFP